MKKVLINGANGKMGQALIRLIETQPELGLTVAVKRETGESVKEDFDIIIDFSTPQGAQEAFALATTAGIKAVNACFMAENGLW